MSSSILRRGVSAATRFAKPLVTEHVREGLVGFLAWGLQSNAVSYRQLSERDDVRIWRFNSEQTYEFSRPVGFGDLPHEIDRLFGTHRCHRPVVLEVPDVVINGPNGLTITSDRQYIAYNYWRHSMRRSSARSLAYDVLYGLNHGVVPELRPSVPPDLPEVDVAVSLLDKHATNYTHWAQECLTLLEGVEVYARETGIEPTLLIPPDSPDFIRESLETMGYDESDCLEWTYDRLRVNRLVLPSPRRCLLTGLERYFRMFSGLRWVRDRARERVLATSPTGTSTRILISRKDATSRRLVNRDEVETALADRGFERFVTGEMSYPEQVRLFSGAELVVGAHGAGMVNTLYADEGAGVIELYGSHYLPANYEIAKGIGLTYGCLQCKPVGSDLRVDIDQLHEAIDRVEAA